MPGGAVLTLFGECPMTGCANLTTPGTACVTCVEAVRPYIRRRGGGEVSDAELGAVLAETATAAPEADPNPGCGIAEDAGLSRCYEPEAHNSSAAHHVRCDISGHHEPDLAVADAVADAIEVRLDRVTAKLQSGSANGGEEWKPNQRCWCCEERRKCHPDPDFPDNADRWICKDCEAIQ